MYQQNEKTSSFSPIFRQLVSSRLWCEPRHTVSDSWTLQSVYDVWETAQFLLRGNSLYLSNYIFLKHSHTRCPKVYRYSPIQVDTDNKLIADIHPRLKGYLSSTLWQSGSEANPIAAQYFHVYGDFPSLA